MEGIVITVVAFAMAGVCSWAISRYWWRKGQFLVNRHLFCILCGIGIACAVAAGELIWAYRPGLHYANNGGVINAVAFSSVQIGLMGIFLAYMSTLKRKENE